MDSGLFSPPRDFVKCCSCGCSCSAITSSSGEWMRFVKRKYDEFEDGSRFFIPGLDVYSNPRVGIENECAALRETVSSQQQAIQDLYTELEEERNASSSAANEAMSMILRLQREKAEIQMEARQFKRFAEEKMAHDQQELLALEDLLYKREQAIQSFTCEIQAYKHRMMSYGLTEAEAEGEKSGLSRNPSMVESLDAQFDLPSYNYPPLKCNLNEKSGPYEGDDDVADVEKYAFGETPRNRDHLKNLEHRIYQMERSPSGSPLSGDFYDGKNVLEKVIAGHSPRHPRHSRRFSSDSSNSFLVKETGPDFSTESPKFGSSFKKTVYVSQTDDYSNLRKMDNASENGDDMSDRVYTIDSVHNGIPYNGVAEPKAGVGAYEDFVTTPRESLNQPDVTDPDIKKLYMRLQALEADRESMRQTLVSMRTDKAQVVLLKEIAQQLCKDMTLARPMPLRKPSIVGSFSFMSIFKWIVSFVFWRKKAHRSKYMCGLSASNIGLLMLLDKGPRLRQWRCLSSTQV
ncbi:myosin-binding protein 7 [Tripterygium wilfordii]|uniref:Myosin-binding protein 7 n=1 Tax=Tripterygium wilfordii TaxID=458696 RepID=A0A7J7CTM0_TRIWF|nr:myosin-binding protein 7-like [Tripterygium wilfordii]XP_038720560.1 myosin-binding protein 7-like [Tripterygium wilfordii]KAF5737384.1 myosin-binding protein 7 [Tripterygium wilfordii]